MHLTTNPDEAALNSRVVGIRMTLLSLRLADNWARLFGDPQAARIALAIIATVAERLTRVELEDDLKSLACPIAHSKLTRCNVSAISAATGINRETARRKVQKLVREGLVVREGNSIMLAPGFTQQDVVSSTVGDQLDELRRTANAFLQLGVLRVQSDVE